MIKYVPLRRKERLYISAALTALRAYVKDGRKDVNLRRLAKKILEKEGYKK